MEKKGDAAVGAAVSVLVALRLGLLYNDIVTPDKGVFDRQPF